MSHNYRCTHKHKCGKSITTKKPRQSTVCPSCKNPTLKEITREERIRAERRKCTCSSYHFPHVKTSKGCVHSKTYEQDMEERHGVPNYTAPIVNEQINVDDDPNNYWLTDE